MRVAQVLAELRLNPDFMRQVVAWEQLPARPVRFGPWPDLHPQLQAALHQQGIEQLFTHQSAAVTAALAGRPVVVATGVASGKSLCYTLPVLHHLSTQPGSRALYLFPTKALAQDQLAAQQALIAAGDLPVSAHIYDGDTPRQQRRLARQGSGVLITNPDMLHAGILPYHPQWRALFSRLAYVVIDEIHAYRGIFGSHVANVLRRLQRLCAFYGSRPQFICCSATIANPQEQAERLTGVAPFTLVDEAHNGAPQGEKALILYNPPLVDEALGLRQSLFLTTMDAAAAFLQADVPTVVFGRSRQGVELLLGYVRDRLATQWGEAEAQARLAGYRGGYLPLERRAIETGLRAGRIQGVIATNALELGVDIGALDAAILAGYPGSIAGFWQQLGRAGRRSDLSVGMLIASNGPLDQYLCRHPRYLLGRTPEHALINPDNPRLVAAHLGCAAYELPFEPGEVWGALGPLDDRLAGLVQQGQLHHAGRRYHWIGDKTPQHSFSLRTSDSNPVVVQAWATPDAAPVVIAQVDHASAPLMVHSGAIYTHQGETYLIETFDWEGRLAAARPAAVDYYTRASVSSNLRHLIPGRELSDGELRHACGEVALVTQVTGFRKVRRYTHETLGYGALDLPPLTLETTGYWMTLAAPLTERLFEAGILLRPNDYGPNWTSQRRLALQRDRYRCRTCGLDGAAEGALLHVHHVRPFREYGYVRGENEAYQQANQLDNLVTLCPACHRQAESAVQQRSALAGLAYVVHNLAPLFVMCDPSDIQVLAEARSPLTGAPTLVIYEQIPAGVGLSERLFELRRELLAAALELVQDCACREGCPACVGPPGEVGGDVKATTHLLLHLLNQQLTPAALMQPAAGRVEP